jgi:hypothetical protein
MTTDDKIAAIQAKIPSFQLRECKVPQPDDPDCCGVGAFATIHGDEYELTTPLRVPDARGWVVTACYRNWLPLAGLDAAAYAEQKAVNEARLAAARVADDARPGLLRSRA